MTTIKYFRNTDADTIKRVVNGETVSHWSRSGERKEWIGSSYNASNMLEAPFKRISRVKVRARGIKA